MASARGTPLCRLFAIAIVLAHAQFRAECEEEVLYVYYAPTCPHCVAVLRLVDRLERDYHIRTERIDLSDPKNVERLANAYEGHGVAPEQWGGTMAAFYGDRWWKDPDAILEDLEAAVRQHAQAAPTPRRARGAERLRAMASSMGPAAVAVAGLIDGINPCAITALIFLVAYLSHLGRSPRQVLAAGILFSAGVFAAYLSIGLGATAALGLGGVVSRASYWVLPVVGGACLVLALWNVYDFARVRKGAADDATLRLPRRFVQAQHAIVRSLARPAGWIGVTVVAGMAISLTELLCTGQVYLPTIMFMWSTPDLRARGLELLVLYVFMFTVPLLVITGGAYFGYGSGRLTGLVRRQTGKIKIAMALILLLFAAYLLGLWRGLL